jgi:hypothetical protein
VPDPEFSAELERRRDRLLQAVLDALLAGPASAGP